MNIAVRYYSRSGNTKKVADAIAKAAGVEAKDCSVPVQENTDLLFLGGSVYGFGLDEHTKDYIEHLSAGNVKAVSVFGTSAIVKTGNQEMKNLLTAKGMNVLKREFYCRGAFTVMHRGHPDAGDLNQAVIFAHSVLDSLKQHE